MAWSLLLLFLPVLLLQVPAAARASPLDTLPEGAAPCKVGTATETSRGSGGDTPGKRGKSPCLTPGAVAILWEYFRFPISG